jgi:dTDP-4-dehydrorhamnose 3,5-epimerase
MFFFTSQFFSFTGDRVCLEKNPFLPLEYFFLLLEWTGSSIVIKESQKFPEVKIITPSIFRDERGYFLETFHQSRYQKQGVETSFKQDNLSYSRYGVIRGMHFQTFPGQAKLISVIKGKIYDVFVDIRPDSKTFGEWDYVYLSDEQHSQLFLPVGFAHGFCCMSKEALVFYKVSEEYSAQTEKGFRYDDADVDIQWPLLNPIVSLRDLEAPSFKDIFEKSSR